MNRTTLITLIIASIELTACGKRSTDLIPAAYLSGADRGDSWASVKALLSLPDAIYTVVSLDDPSSIPLGFIGLLPPVDPSAPLPV